MSDTPRTDTVESAITKFYGYPNVPHQMATLARQLERENRDLLEAAKMMLTYIETHDMRALDLRICRAVIAKAEGK
jgi:pyrroloquinoline quinone (PQQ) biosynthesis protein C